MMFEDLPYPSPFASVSMGRIDYEPHNRGVTPIFFIESVIDHAASEQAGRAIYRDMERVRIQVAGDQFSAAVMPVDDMVKARFEEAYDKWKRKGQRLVTGTPLEKWPLATPRFIKEMEFLSIFSVDDLASVADVHLDRIADGREWRDKAAAWLKSANDGAAAARFAAENNRLRGEVAELRAMIEKVAGTYGAEKAEKIGRKPMSDERRAAFGLRMKAAREAKRMQE